MISPINDLFTSGGFAHENKIRFMRAGVPDPESPGETARAIPPDTLQGYETVNTAIIVDCAVGKRDGTNFKIKFESRI